MNKEEEIKAEDFATLSMSLLGDGHIIIFPEVANRIGLLNAIFMQECFAKEEWRELYLGTNESAVLSNKEWKNCIKELKDLKLLVKADKEGKKFSCANFSRIVDALAEDNNE